VGKGSRAVWSPVGGFTVHLVNKTAYFADLQYVFVESGLLHGLKGIPKETE
jgi:hypothetical protein